MILWLMSCQSEVVEIPVTCNDAITYETVAEPFLRNYCTGCHSSHLAGSSRFGAPAGVNLDSFQGAKNWAARSYVRAVHFQNMPPSGGVSQAERERFKQWALCGTKGQESNTPVIEPEQRVTSRTISSVIFGAEPNHYLLTRVIINEDWLSEGRLLIREELYRTEGINTFFEGYNEYTPEGTIISSVFFEPDLPLSPSTWVDELEVLVSIDYQGSNWTEIQNWHSIQEYQGLWEIDVHDREPNPLHTLWWNDQGEEWGWHTSSIKILSSSYGITIDGLHWESQQFFGQDHIESETSFPLGHDMGWIDLWIEWTE